MSHQSPVRVVTQSRHVGDVREALRRAVPMRRLVVECDDDGHAGRGPNDIVVVDATPWACHEALRTWASSPCSLVSADALDDIGVAVDMAGHGMVGVAARIRELAAEVPAASPRQYEVLRSLMAGYSNSQAGRLLHVSEATVKREVAALSEILGLNGRACLACAGFELGMRPAGSDGHAQLPKTRAAKRSRAAAGRPGRSRFRVPAVA